VENAVSAATAGSGGQIVIAGAGYAGLHVALRLTVKLRNNPKIQLTLADRRELPQLLFRCGQGFPGACLSVSKDAQDRAAGQVRAAALAPE
jgi:2-polyprenyl-6-methoxyphenol hydroxylase-like FAD-dependent oxidoreductase